jgi:hypothetical protein
LLVYVPQGAGGRDPVQVTVDGPSSSTTSDFSISYARPHVLACTQSGVPGGHFAVSGRYFGTVINAQIVVTIGEKACTTVSLLSPHSKIEATIPQGAGSKLPVGVQIAGVDATLDQGCTFSYQGTPSCFSRLGLCWQCLGFFACLSCLSRSRSYLLTSSFEACIAFLFRIAKAWYLLPGRRLLEVRFPAQV